MSDISDTLTHLASAAKPDVKHPPQCRRIVSAELFGSQRELVIEHVGQEYRLRITQQGKLILTK